MSAIILAAGFLVLSSSVWLLFLSCCFLKLSPTSVDVLASKPSCQTVSTDRQTQQWLHQHLKKWLLLQIKINVFYNPKRHPAPLLSAGRERLSQSKRPPPPASVIFMVRPTSLLLLLFLSSTLTITVSHRRLLFLCCPGCSSFHLSVSPSSSVMPWARSSSRTLSRCPGSGKPWPVRLEPNSVLWWTSFQMTVSDSPVVLEVPTEKINLRSHATRSSLSTLRPFSLSGR